MQEPGSNCGLQHQARTTCRRRFAWRLTCAKPSLTRRAFHPTASSTCAPGNPHSAATTATGSPSNTVCLARCRRTARRQSAGAMPSHCFSTQWTSSRLTPQCRSLVPASAHALANDRLHQYRRRQSLRLPQVRPPERSWRRVGRKAQRAPRPSRHLDGARQWNSWRPCCRALRGVAGTERM